MAGTLFAQREATLYGCSLQAVTADGQFQCPDAWGQNPQLVWQQMWLYSLFPGEHPVVPAME